MTRPRVFVRALASELGVSESDCIDACKKLGIYCPSSMTYIAARDADRVRNRVKSLFIGPQLPIGRTVPIKRQTFGARERIRIWEVAKQCKISNEEILNLANSLGLTADSPLSTISNDEANLVVSEHLRLVALGASKSSVGVQHSSSEKKNRTTSVRYPSPSQYDDSLFDPKRWFTSDVLQDMTVYPAGLMGETSIVQTGGFACVAKTNVQGADWAIRLLYRHQQDIQDRYQTICELQKSGGLPSIVLPVRYFDNEIAVEGFSDRFPVVLIEWVDGQVLNKVVHQACMAQDVALLEMLRQAMRNLESEMNKFQLSHGDLSGDNLMVVKDGDTIQIKLLDYDSLWFPEVGNLLSSVGDGELQHPGVAGRAEISNGPGADVVAFRIYDLVLQGLQIDPELGIDEKDYEFKFLVTRSELKDCSTKLAKLVQQADSSGLEELIEILNSPYEQLTDFIRRSDIESEFSVDQDPDPLVNPEFKWTFDMLMSTLELSAGQLRTEARKVNLTSTQLEEGISNSLFEVLKLSLQRKSDDVEVHVDPALATAIRSTKYFDNGIYTVPLDSISSSGRISPDDLNWFLTKSSCRWRKVGNEYFVSKPTAEYLRKKLNREDSVELPLVSLDERLRPFLKDESENLSANSTASNSELKPGNRSVDFVASQFGVSVEKLVKQLASALGHQKQWKIIGVSESEVESLKIWREKKNSESTISTRPSTPNSQASAATSDSIDRHRTFPYRGTEAASTLTASSETLQSGNRSVDLVASQFGVSVEKLVKQLASALGHQKQWKVVGVSNSEVEKLKSWLEKKSREAKPIIPPAGKPLVNLGKGNQSLDLVASQFGVSVEKLVKQLASALGHQKQWKVVGVSESEIRHLREWRTRTGKKPSAEFTRVESISKSNYVLVEDLAREFGITAIDVVSALANQKRSEIEPDHNDFRRWWTSGADETEALNLRARMRGSGNKVNKTLGRSMNRGFRRLLRKRQE